MKFCNPTLLGNKEEFKETFLVPIDRGKFKGSTPSARRKAIESSEVNYFWRLFYYVSYLHHTFHHTENKSHLPFFNPSTASVLGQNIWLGDEMSCALVVLIGDLVWGWDVSFGWGFCWGWDVLRSGLLNFHLPSKTCFCILANIIARCIVSSWGFRLLVPLSELRNKVQLIKSTIVHRNVVLSA